MRRRCFFRLFALLAAPPWAAAQGEAPPAPQLARSYRGGLHLPDWLVSEKYDGVRAWWDGQALYSRTGRRLPAPAWFTEGWPRMALDGELWAGRGAFEQAQSAAARQQPDDAAWRGLRFMAFDAPRHGGPATPFAERLTALQAAIGRAGRPTLQAVPQRRVATEAELLAWLREVTRGGGEGLMLHHANAPWQSGRSGQLLKLKPHEDAEARVIAHLPGKGRHAGRLGALLVQTPEGRRFRIGSGFTDAQREAPPPVGAWVTYRYRGLHEGSGLPRFATFLRVREEGL